MTTPFNRRTLLGTTLIGGAAMAAGISPAAAQLKILLRLSAPATATDQRAVGLNEKFGPAIKDFADSATLERHPVQAGHRE